MPDQPPLLLSILADSSNLKGTSRIYITLSQRPGGGEKICGKWEQAESLDRVHGVAVRAILREAAAAAAAVGDGICFQNTKQISDSNVDTNIDALYPGGNAYEVHLR